MKYNFVWFIVNNKSIINKIDKVSSKVSLRESHHVSNDANGDEQNSQVLPETLSLTKVMCTKIKDHESSEKNKNKVNERNDKNDETYDNKIENDDSGKWTDDSISDSDEKDGIWKQPTTKMMKVKSLMAKRAMKMQTVNLFSTVR